MYEHDLDDPFNILLFSVSFTFHGYQTGLSGLLLLFS